MRILLPDGGRLLPAAACVAAFGRSFLSTDALDSSSVSKKWSSSLRAA
jgi:hypothetical protein